MTEEPDFTGAAGDFSKELPDPYRAPADFEGATIAPYPLETAGKGRRFLGFVIDYAAWMSFAFVFIVVAQVVMAMTSGDVEDMPEDTPGSELLYQVLGMLFMFFYYMVFEGFFSRTIGKFVTGTIVVNRDGYPPSFGQIVGRTLGRFIPLDPFSFLASRARGWHDSVSGTYVVRRRKKGPTSAEL